MPRIAHGAIQTTAALQDAHATLARAAAAAPLAFAAVEPTEMNGFDFLLPTLQQDDANLLPETPDTPALLKALGATMDDPASVADGPGDADVPAIFTYFGQFVDHDITFEVQPADLPPSRSASISALLDPNMAPLAASAIRNSVKNFRSPTLDLDSVYGLPAPRDPENGDKLLLGTVTNLNNPNPPLARRKR